MKKPFRLLLIFSLLINTVLLIYPIQAHTTLGRLTPDNPYRSNDSDTNNGHVPGLTGYVWPGGGKDWWLVGSSDYLVSGEPPGYQSPWGNYPANAPASWYQLRGNTYAPFGAILASTEDHRNTGDLIFALNFTNPDYFILPPVLYYFGLVIYIPPEFEPPIDWEKGDASNIVTTITNDYKFITVYKADNKDPFGPNWWVISITMNLTFSADNGYAEWYYLRVNGVSAPIIAGRYFFKMFAGQLYPVTSGPVLSAIPVENWPVLLVKGEVDPGIIYGSISYGSFNQTLYGLPLELPGRVRVVGTAIDPYTGKSTGRLVEARGYFNASAQGHYEVEGVAPGVYDVYASAAGYPEVKVAEDVTILPGKSLHLDIQLNPGAVVHGTIYSKHGFGETPWEGLRPITVEIYDSNEYIEEHLRSFSPINLTHAPYTSHTTEEVGGLLPTPPWPVVSPDPIWPGGIPHFAPKLAAFPWEGPLSYYFWTGPGSPAAPLDPWGIHNGVGPAQFWWVDPYGLYTNGGGSSAFVFKFGQEGVYGAPTDFDGHVPQVLATWINGLTPGTYYIRAWINGYVQTDINGVFKDYMLTIPAGEWPGDTHIPIDLQLGGKIDKTIHFHDLPGSLETNPIGGPDPGRYLIVEAFDEGGNLVGFNFTYVPASASSISIMINGFGMAGPNNRPLGLIYLGDRWMKYFLYRYRGIRDYGLMPGTYTIRAYMRGYIQQEFELASISLSGRTTKISNHMYRGAGINVTVYSFDSQHPNIPRPWIYGFEIVIPPLLPLPFQFPAGIKLGIPIFLSVYDSAGRLEGNIYYWSDLLNWWIYPTQAGGETSIPYPGWPGDSYLKFNGSVYNELWGPDAPLAPSPLPEESRAATIWLFRYWLRGGFLWSEDRYRYEDYTTRLALETDTYSIEGHTYGYVQKRDATVYAQKGSQADILLSLTIGANITLTTVFKHEGILTGLPYHSAMRVRVYNEHGELVAGSVTSWPIPNMPQGPAGTITTSYIPAGTTSVTWTLSGIFLYVDPQWYALGYSIIGGEIPFIDYGIDAYPNYQGTWTVEIDMINLYRPDMFHPPPPGLLLGESYHLIEGGTGFTGDYYSFNHLGPWEQKKVIIVPNVPLWSEASVEFELDLRGLLYGQVAGFTWSNELRPISWASITAAGPSGEFTSYSFDGYYEMYLPSGDYKLTVQEWSGGAGHLTKAVEIKISEGGMIANNFLDLERSEIPIPEFTVPLYIVSIASTVTLLIAFKWRSKVESR